MLPGNRSIKQQDEQNKVQLAQLETDNARLQAEVSAAKARAVKLENYTRRENIRLLNASVNSSSAHPPWALAFFFFKNGKFPGVGINKSVKCPRVETQKEGKCPTPGFT